MSKKKKNLHREERRAIEKALKAYRQACLAYDMYLGENQSLYGGLLGDNDADSDTSTLSPDFILPRHNEVHDTNPFLGGSATNTSAGNRGKLKYTAPESAPTITLEQVYILRADLCECQPPCPMREPVTKLPAAFESLDDVSDFVRRYRERFPERPEPQCDAFNGRTIPYARIALKLAGSTRFRPTTVFKNSATGGDPT